MVRVEPKKRFQMVICCHKVFVLPQWDSVKTGSIIDKRKTGGPFVAVCLASLVSASV